MSSLNAADAARGLLAGMLLDPLSTPAVEAIVERADFPVDMEGNSQPGDCSTC